MNIGETAYAVAFVLCALIAVVGALGMTTTMSMFRSGIFLMASFIGVAGLFILLAADLMGLLQIMMYIGGMLVMILFMVLFMHDPGGAMMAAMTDMMSPVEKLFSAGLQQKKKDAGNSEQNGHRKKEGWSDHEQHGDRQKKKYADRHIDHSKHDIRGNKMGDMDMSMVTPVRPLAAWLAVAIGIALALLVVVRPAWPIHAALSNSDAAHAVGMLLMGKYMVAFEGAGFLILLGIFGAVFLARVEHHPDTGNRGQPVAHTDAPPGIASDPLMPSASNADCGNTDDDAAAAIADNRSGDAPAPQHGTDDL